jgi:hypothetical protein
MTMAVPDDDGAPVLVVPSAMLLPMLLVLAVMAVVPVGVAPPVLVPVVVGERRRARQQECGAERQNDLVGHCLPILPKLPLALV